MLVLGLGVLAIRNEPFLNDIPGGRLFQISVSDGTAQTRFWVWGEAWQGFASGRFSDGVRRTLPPSMTNSSIQISISLARIQRPGLIVRIAYSSTIFRKQASSAFLHYLTMFAMFSSEFFRLWKERGGSKNSGLHSDGEAILFGFLLAYLVQGVAIFDVFPMYINIFLFVAFHGVVFRDKEATGDESLIAKPPTPTPIPMRPITKQVIAVIASLLHLFVAAYGSYLPMRKAEMFIATLQGIQSNPVIGRLESRLRFRSIIRRPSVRKNSSETWQTAFLVSSRNSPDPSSTAQLLNYMDSYYAPIVARDKGMSFGQDLYLLGAIHEVAFVKTQNPAYLELAQQYYAEGHSLGPDRPQPLYGLFDVYRFMGDETDTVATARTILGLWPTDTNIQAALAAMQAVKVSPIKK